MASCTTEYGVILFRSTQAAIQAERVLTQAGFGVQLVPTPRQFSSDCGTALRTGWESLGEARSTLDAAGVPYDSTHKIAMRSTPGKRR
jgi:hypothetical protein